jgi:hypothetical protein
VKGGLSVNGVYTNPRLRCLRPALERWIAINRKLSHEWSPDTPWWYNERASLSILAGAIWQENGTAFEEFSWTKTRSGKLGHGRVDLEFSLGVYGYRAEAKLRFLRVSQGFAHIGRLNDQLAEATADIRCCAAEKWIRRLGVLFVAPSIPESREGDLHAVVKKLGHLADRINCDAYALAFPVLPHLPRYENRCYPGAMVFLKEVHR